MIEFDVDMGYLLEDGELDSVVLNDENGEYEPMRFIPDGETEEIAYSVTEEVAYSVSYEGKRTDMWYENGVDFDTLDEAIEYVESRKSEEDSPWHDFEITEHRTTRRVVRRVQ